jgi:hypothetical protein
MSAPAEPRFWARVNMNCALHMASGGTSPDTHPRSWFFEIPAHCHDAAHWQELMPRIFYDLNVAMRRREPGDAAYIGLGKFDILPFKPKDVVTWDGVSPSALPWVEPDKHRIWEPAVCYFVDEFGRYDVLSAHDFTELLLHRCLQEGAIDAAKFIDFLNHYYKAAEPAAGQRLYNEAATRFPNLVTVRVVPGVFRKQPGAQPFVCGPVRSEDR